MRRREFITLLGGAAATWPLAARAQQPTMPVVGYLALGSATGSAPRVAAFKQRLSEVGYVEGRNIAIEYRFANGQFNRLPEPGANLVRFKPALIFAAGPPAVRAVKEHTATIPIAGYGGSAKIWVGCAHAGDEADSCFLVGSRAHGRRYGEGYRRGRAVCSATS
jgi:putative ABC transport system substrate-binding protein